MSLPAIRVSNLSKRYQLGITHAGTIREVIRRSVNRLFGRRVRDQRSEVRDQTSDPTSDLRPPTSDSFWALKDVSFDVQPGEVLGIIGANGAGKSTLLKILSRITAPTEGRVEINGRVASLLEVGTGFHPELTGRENVFLNGAILGMTKTEIRRKFDEIVAFAEVEKFVDTPVKRYSSGMYVRLAFAVAAHLDPEVLLLDEVLAVGDAEFQKKCLGKMGEVARGGRTVLFVSHNMVAVQSLCRRAALFRGGRLVADGKSTEVVKSYLAAFHGSDESRAWNSPDSAPGDHLARIKRIRILPACPDDGNLITMQTAFQVETEYWTLLPGRVLHLTYHLVNDQGITVLTSGSGSRRHEAGLYKAVCSLPGGLLNSGGYSLKLLIVENESRVTYEREGIASFTVIDAQERDYAYMGREPGVVQPLLPWATTRI